MREWLDRLLDHTSLCRRCQHLRECDDYEYMMTRFIREHRERP